MPSADYIWPHTLNKKVREVVGAEGGEVVGEEYFPMDHMDYERVVEDIMASGADVVFNTIVPPGLTPFLEQLHRAGFTARGGQIVCTYFDENFLNLVPAEHVEGLYGCLDYYRGVDDPFSIELLNRYESLYPGSALFTAGSACTGTYRALKLWEAAVREAGSLDQDDVIAALDHARIEQGPGGPAEMVPGQHHVRMNMYIARSEGGTFNGGQEPGPHRPEGMRGRERLTSSDACGRRCGTRGRSLPRGRPRARDVPATRRARRSSVRAAATGGELWIRKQRISWQPWISRCERCENRSSPCRTRRWTSSRTASRGRSAGWPAMR